MKRLLMGLAAALIAANLYAGRVYDWPTLPDGVLPDSEVSTNISLHVNVERLSHFSVRLLVATNETSEVLVAIGNDANGDGDLSFAEAAFVFGMDCGRRYFANYGTEGVFYDVGDTLNIPSRHCDPSWNLAKVVKRGTGPIGEVVTETVENKSFVIRLR